MVDVVRRHRCEVGVGPGKGEREQLPSAPGTASCGQECGVHLSQDPGPGAVEATLVGQGSAGYRAQGHSFCPLAPIASWGSTQAGTLARRHPAGESSLNP